MVLYCEVANGRLTEGLDCCTGVCCCLLLVVLVSIAQSIMFRHFPDTSKFGIPWNYSKSNHFILRLKFYLQTQVLFAVDRYAN